LLLWYRNNQQRTNKERLVQAVKPSLFKKNEKKNVSFLVANNVGWSRGAAAITWIDV
jgi:hypothetical protein